MSVRSGATYDVVIIGSGGAGLCAALSARAAGASVLLLEATSTVGGTTVFSGGQVWIPNHPYMSATGIADSREEGLAYLRNTSPERGGPADEARWAAFVDNGPRMIRFLEERTPLRFKPNDYPDYFAEAPGGKPKGRCLESIPFAPGRLGGRRRDLRYPPDINRTNLPLTWAEVHEGLQNFTAREMLKLGPRILYRYAAGQLTGSRALVAGLYAGCLQSGVEVALLARAKELLVTDGKVTGVRFDYPGRRVDVSARGGVILATGGFDWNPDLVKQYVPGRIDYTACVPSNRGDGLLMATAAGARLARMDDAMYWPGIRKPDYFYEGAPLGTLASSLRSFPHCIVVNRTGRRFANESGANFGLDLQVIDRATGQLPNLPCWSVFDAQFLKYGALEAGIMPNKELPSWVRRFDSLDALATQLGIDGGALVETVRRFNACAREGRDPEFRRGEAMHDRCYGAGNTPFPNLGTLEKPPFCAIELVATTLGTKGGPMTTERWEVIQENGTPIPGLYAIGTVADALGRLQISGGGTLGPGLTAGYIAANAAAWRARGGADIGRKS